ncbi:hypothetical protein NBRC116583_05620 [Arenicella sp. 4NH20-0111]|uniref:Clp protease N-terminal domain-containing protein n=1 Tax=Arenicella sp. 4NH20-0111 TaxID=3127648 RepID=UPI0031021D89
MFKRLMLRFRDMKTISKLISGADEQAHISGEEKPGAEHFVLSALNLEDGSAKRVFEKIGADTNDFRGAIKQQYTDALSSIGINGVATDIHPDPVEPNIMLHNSQPSGQELMKSLYAIKQSDKNRPLLGAHVISVAAEMEHGVVARALKVMGVDRERLAKLAKNEIESN